VTVTVTVTVIVTVTMTVNHTSKACNALESESTIETPRVNLTYDMLIIKYSVTVTVTVTVIVTVTVTVTSTAYTVIRHFF
jgi:hypothetical protein